MGDKIVRIFKCMNGHEYKSKKPICSFFNDIILVMAGSKLRVSNDFCKFCGEKIISETDYVNDKVVMGAVLYT